MILEMLKNLYPTVNENVLIAVVKDLEDLCRKQTRTEELIEWIDKLVIAHVISEALKIEDDSKPIGDDSSSFYQESTDEEDD